MDKQVTDTPLVSIITTTYNHGKFIIDCIRSVQAQTLSSWEMIIVDDGSTDHTEEIVKNFTGSDSRVQYHRQQNKGIFNLYQSYNFALHHSRGKYIAILEADDLWAPERLEKQVQIMESNPEVVLCWGRSEHVKSDDLEYVYKIHPAPAKEETENYYFNEPCGSILNVMYFESCMPPLTFLIRKDALLKIGGFIQYPDIPATDFSTVFELSKTGTFFFDNSILGKQRIYPDSVTKTYSMEGILDRYLHHIVNHYRGLPENIKRSLCIDENDITRFHNSYKYLIYASSGRFKLIRKDFSGARKDFLKTILNSGAQLSWKIRAFIGYIHGLINTDMEWVARLSGRPAYK